MSDETWSFMHPKTTNGAPGVSLNSKKAAASKFTPDDLRRETAVIQLAYEALSTLNAEGRTRAMQYLESLLARGGRPVDPYDQTPF